MTTTQARSAALAVSPIGIISLSFVPLFAGVATVLWFAGFAVMIAAVAVAFRASHDTRRGTPAESTGRRRMLLVVAVFTVGALIGVGLVGTRTAQATTIPVPVVSSSTPGTSEGEVPGLATSLARMATVKGESADSALRAARDMKLVPLSGLGVDYSRAKVLRTGDTVIVSVPLTGTAIPEATNLTFVMVGGKTTVIENEATLLDPDHAAFRSWTDSKLVKDVVVTKPGVTQGEDVTTRGINWDKLNKCLSSAGISWALVAIVGASCGVACATAVLCLPCVSLAAGLTGGTVAKCVSNAFS